MHFGREDDATERANEDALLDCLDAHAGSVDHLYLVGDVFDSYVEYRHLVPKGFVRFQARLAQWTDDGVPVTYLVGNHDPWHRDYFARELGVEVVSDAVDAVHYGRHVHLTHGDAVASAHGLYARLRPVLRHPVPVWLYRTLLPGDFGVRLAQWVSRRLHDDAPDPDVVASLRRYARRVLHASAVDVVVMGHSHVPALHDAPDGAYLNTGSWYGTRTFGRLDSDGIHLCEWNGTRAVNIEAART